MQLDLDFPPFFFFDSLVEIKLSRGDSSYTFFQGFIIIKPCKQSEAWNRLENTL